MKKIFISAVAIGLTLSQMSCNNAADTANNTATAPATTTMEAPTSLEPTPTVEGTATESVTPAANAPISTTGNKNEALNPPHGQPGHRCDIPEGAPLSSPPQQTNQHQPAMPAAQATPVAPNAPSMNVQPQMPAQKTAPGFSGKANPEHGQPGHRCDLQVGEILP